jgi:beta-glucosidase
MIKMAGRFRAVLTVLLLAAVEAAGEAGPEPLVVFSGQAISPYALFLGDEGGWKVPADQPPTSSRAGHVALEPNVEGAAPRVTWNGEGLGQVFLSDGAARDLRPFKGAEPALVILMKVHSRPNRSVTLRMGCGYPCAADADVTRLFRWLPMEEWAQVAIDLDCFTDMGLDLERVSTPFLLLTRGRLSVSLADVRLVPGMGDGATVAC